MTRRAVGAIPGLPHGWPRRQCRHTTRSRYRHPERRVTVHIGDMGYTIGPFAGSARCPERRVSPWREENMMRLVAFAVATCCYLQPGLALGQDTARQLAGSWKLKTW